MSTYSFSVARGSTFRAKLQFKIGTVPMNLADYTIAANVFTAWGGAVATPIEIQPVDLSIGRFDLFISNTNTDTLTSAHYVYSVFRHRYPDDGRVEVAHHRG
jgi:hypothetical protein